MILKAKRLPRTSETLFYDLEVPANFNVWIPAEDLFAYLEMAERTRSRWLAELEPKWVRRSGGGRDPRLEIFEFSKVLYGKFLASVGRFRR